MNNDEIRANPPKIDPLETHLHTPTDDARRITGTGLGGETFIPFSESRRRFVFLSRTQNLTKLKETTKNGALPPALAEIHRAPMALGPPGRRRTCGGNSGRQKP